MAAHVDPDAHVMTLVNVFTVDADQQQHLIDMLDEATEKVMKSQPGFISASIHKGADGKHVINYAQWRRKDDFLAIQKNPEAREHMKHIWRPPSFVRPIAVGLIRRNDELLLMAVRNDDGVIAGWRPLGGSIEFGERAADALRREFAEEAGLAIVEPALLTVMENLYWHHGARGHEIVFVFEAKLADDTDSGPKAFSFDDGGVRNEVRWVALANFVRGEAELFPAGLLERLLRPQST